MAGITTQAPGTTEGGRNVWWVVGGEPGFEVSPPGSPPTHTPRQFSLLGALGAAVVRSPFPYSASSTFLHPRGRPAARGAEYAGHQDAGIELPGPAAQGE